VFKIELRKIKRKCKKARQRLGINLSLRKLKERMRK